MLRPVFVRASTGFARPLSFPRGVVLGLVVALASLVPRAGEAGETNVPAAVNSSAHGRVGRVSVVDGELQFGQAHLLTFTLSMGAWVAFRRGRAPLGGFLLGAATVFALSPS
jgi:hypothetical protein